MHPPTINGIADPLAVTPENIGNYQQNRLRYVAIDLHRLAGVPIETTRKVLLARGVAKWLRNRRVFIEVKHDMKERIKRMAVDDPVRVALQPYYEKLQVAAKSNRWTLEAW